MRLPWYCYRLVCSQGWRCISISRCLARKWVLLEGMHTSKRITWTLQGTSFFFSLSEPDEMLVSLSCNKSVDETIHMCSLVFSSWISFLFQSVSLHSLVSKTSQRPAMCWICSANRNTNATTRCPSSCLFSIPIYQKGGLLRLMVPVSLPRPEQGNSESANFTQYGLFLSLTCKSILLPAMCWIISKTKTQVRPGMSVFLSASNLYVSNDQYLRSMDLWHFYSMSQIYWKYRP